MSRVIIMAGGTAGHVMPALAVAAELRRRGVSVSWIGTPNSMESRLVRQAKIAFDSIEIAGLRKSGIIRAIVMPYMLLKAMAQATCLLYPHATRWRWNKRAAAQARAEGGETVVLGMGGFVAGPGGLVSALLRIPMVVHEQNSSAGLTNKWLSKLTRHVLSGFPVAQGIENSKWVGNPVDRRIASLAPYRARLDRRATSKISAVRAAGISASSSAQAPLWNTATDPVRVLVVGGSQGASVFNQHLPALLSDIKVPFQTQNTQSDRCNAGTPCDRTDQVLRAQQIHLAVWHQCGCGARLPKMDMEQSSREVRAAVAAAYADQAITARVDTFINDMSQAYCWCDIVICRAGAMTISELSAAGVAAYAVPYPHAVSDHQTLNAKFLEAQGGGIIVDQNSFVQGTWLPDFADLLADKERLIAMSECARAMARPDAGVAVADFCEEVMNACKVPPRSRATGEVSLPKSKPKLKSTRASHE